jgi:hypothetical protein
MATKNPRIKAGQNQRQITFICTIKSESALAVHLFLNAIEVDLAQDGDTWSGKKALNVGDTVTVKVNVKGLDGTAWAAEVDADCPAGPAKLIAQNGKIGGLGGNGFEKDVNIPADPCAKS